MSSCKVDEACWRCITAFAYIRAAPLGKMVLQHNKRLPLVAVRIGNPGFILDGVTAGGLHLVACSETGLHPPRTERKHVFSRSDLQTEMRERAAFSKRQFVQSEIEWRISHVELRVSGADLGWLDAKHLFVKFNALD